MPLTKVEMVNRCVRRNALSLIVLVVYLALFAIASWASIVEPRGGAPQRWRPRKMPAGAELVGDRVCAGCHPDKVSSHARTGMAQAMETIAESKVLAANPSMKFLNGAYTYEIRRNDKESVYSVTDGKETISLPILYAFGVGKAGQTYILQYEGALHESRVSYYSEIRGLDLTIGALRAPTSLKDAMGRRLADSEVSNCFSCHSTGGVIEGKVHFDKAIPGVRCEACHGPGGRHATAGKAGEPNANLIFNPGRLGGDELSQDFCGSCHRGNDEPSLLKGMEINNVRFQPYRIFHSKCYSDDRRISCTACHDPHQPIKQDSVHYDSKCLACHAPMGAAALQKSPQAAQSAQTPLPRCRVGTKDCVSCHMPKIGPAAAHFKFTDHYIRIVKPKEAYPN